MYGVGQGLNEGVRMAGSFLTDAMKMKQQQKQFDAGMERDYDRMALEKAWVDARQKHLRDRLIIEQGWKAGFYGDNPSLTAPQGGPPQPSAGPSVSPQPLPGPASSTPAQATIRPMQMTPAQYLLPAPRIVGKPAREFMPSTLSGNRSRWPR